MDGSRASPYPSFVYQGETLWLILSRLTETLEPVGGIDFVTSVCTHVLMREDEQSDSERRGREAEKKKRRR